MTVEGPDGLGAGDGLAVVVELVETAVEAFDEADHERALGLLTDAEKILGDAAMARSDHDTLSVAVLRTRGEVLTDMGHHQAALDSLHQSFELARSTSAVADVEIIGILNATGMACKYSGRYDDAAAAYDEAMVTLDSIELTTLDDDPGELDERGLDEIRAVLLHNIGGNAHASGDFELAEDATEEALALHLELEGEGSYAVASDRAALAAILHATGRAAEAERLLRAAIRSFDATVGRRHRDTASAFHNLGDALGAQGATDEARQAFEEAIALRRSMFGDGHPDLAMSLNNLAVLEARCGREERARALLAEASAIATTTLHAEHPLSRMARENLAALDRRAVEGDSDQGPDGARPCPGQL